MRLLRPVNGVAGILHPAQIVARLGEIPGQGVSRLAPLRPLVARLAQTETPPHAGSGIDDLQAFVRMIGIAQDAFAAAVRRDVPGVVFGDGRDLARGPVHAADREGHTVKTMSPVVPRKVSWTMNSSLPCW